ncbi:MerR family transcriptional regulator [Dactylosporangium sp. NPDC005572]|uniref:MerR family transcriptional regulator n=1 Tax=Dactylosporangium sp. NPDC005572 TaxID=3156889 RepID=UPI0033B56904
MRIKELADLTGTTVRTIRYYHQVDLLPVPAVRYGHRDYDLVHVARLVRIRWLTQAGVPLSRIAGMLRPTTDRPADPAEAARDAVLVDLRATLVALDDQAEQLQAQRDRVSRLVESVERDGNLSPMPPAMARFYADLERRAGDEQVRREIRRERDSLELAFYRGDMPPEADVFYQGFDEEQLTESLELFGRAAARPDTGPDPTDEEIAQMASAQVARLRRHLGADLPRIAGSIDMDVARRAADLFTRLSPDHDRRRTRAIAEAIVAMVEEARPQ